MVEGRLKLEQWTDQGGNKRSKHVVICENLKMLGGGDGQPSAPRPQQAPQPQQQPQTAAPEYEVDVDNDEPPF